MHGAFNTEKTARSLQRVTNTLFVFKYITANELVLTKLDRFYIYFFSFLLYVLVVRYSFLSLVSC